MLEFYQRIKSRREELNMSQDELAKKLGYRSRSSINKIEKGINDIPQSKILAFAIALNTTPEYLMGWIPKKNQQKNFSDDETELINGYRSLDNSKRQALFSLLAFLKEQPITISADVIQKNRVGNNIYSKNGNISVNVRE